MYAYKMLILTVGMLHCLQEASLLLVSDVTRSSC